MIEELHNRIEDYLAGRLNETEKIVFEDQLRQDPSMKKAFEEYQLISEVLETEVEEGLKARFREIDKENPEERDKISFNKWWILATIIVGVLVVMLSIWKQTSEINPQQIAAQYGVEENIDKYRSISSTEKFTEQETIYIDKMKRAATFIEQKKYNEARAVYNSLSEEIPIIRDNKEWAIAMSHYLESGRKNETFQRILDKILLTPEHNCYKQAVQVESEVNSFWGRLKN